MMVTHASHGKSLPSLARSARNELTFRQLSQSNPDSPISAAEAASELDAIWDEFLSGSTVGDVVYDSIEPICDFPKFDFASIQASTNAAITVQEESRDSSHVSESCCRADDLPAADHNVADAVLRAPAPVTAQNLKAFEGHFLAADLGAQSSESSKTLGAISENGSVSGVVLSSPRLTKGRHGLVVEIPNLHLSSPPSHYAPFFPSAPRKSELDALEEIRSALPRLPEGLNFVEIQLDDFSVYRDTATNPAEMCCLHHLDTKWGYKDFWFDGIISAGSKRFYVDRVPINTMPIDGYGREVSHTVCDKVWLQSKFCQDSDVYYKLGQPTPAYRRFFDPFMCIADLAKHFVDFLAAKFEEKVRVSIRHFRSEFRDWVLATHGNLVDGWLSQHPSGDYRSSIVANIGYLHKESMSVLARDGHDGRDDVYFHSIWAEILDLDQYPPRLCKGGSSNQNPTIVTRYTFELFSHLPFGSCLRNYPTSSKTLALIDQTSTVRSLESARPMNLLRSNGRHFPAHDKAISCVRPGDTISTSRDDKESGSRWERETAYGFADADRWFALVQAVRTNRAGFKEFEVIWYYRPVDTLCGLMKYPWSHELFLSDHCSCHEKYKIQEHEVLGFHDVEFGGDSETQSEFFCRQVYLSEDRKWQSLQERHLRCHHRSSASHVSEKYETGETFLVQVHRGDSRSEPCELVKHNADSDRRLFTFRRLWRRSEVDPATPPAPCNELVYSSQFVTCDARQVVGRCSVRFFNEGAKIPTPYDRDGVGCMFFITCQEVIGPDGSFCLVPLRTAPESLKQGFDPAASATRLNGLDLFCGGGNFGRGLEEGGAVQMKWANDYDKTAMHTYMANSEHSQLTSPFLGSIDELHKLASNGDFSEAVPAIGTVDFISAGSPCPGFSRFTNDKTTSKQRKNQSLVAAYASFVDLYRPKYGILENVPGIIQPKADRDQDVFSQLLCAIVGLGYQAQLFLLDASSQGSAQRRTRVFLTFAAPGHRLPDRPQQSHSHPPGTYEQRLGRLPNGEAIAQREIPTTTPFPFTDFVRATRGLPKIYDGQPDTCIPFPDHRVSFGMSRLIKRRVSLIPKRPWGMNFRTASAGVLSAAERNLFAIPLTSAIQKKSNSYGRMHPHRLMETIMTKQHPGDHKGGRVLHWDEDRGITVMEARRGQGFPDEEVILGGPREQYKIVGNSVAREVALALGLAFREAWVASYGGTEPFIRAKKESSSGTSNSTLMRRPEVPDTLPPEKKATLMVAMPSFSSVEAADGQGPVQKRYAEHVGVSMAAAATTTLLPKRPRHV